jgi:hypothetical protein
MDSITKFVKEDEVFYWTQECQVAWKTIKRRYMDVLILVVSMWDLEFHVQNAPNLVIGVILT